MHRYSNFLRASRFPVISTKHRNAGNYSHAYESSISALRGRAVHLNIMNPCKYSENNESRRLRYIRAPMKRYIYVSIKIPEITLNLRGSDDLKI